MTTLQIVLLIVGILMLIFIPFGIFVLLKWIFLKKYSNYLKKLETFLREEPYIDTLTILRTIDVKFTKSEKRLVERITNSPNDQIQDINVNISKIQKEKEEYARLTIEIEEKITELRKIKNKLFNKLDHSKVFSCHPIIVEANNKINELNLLKKNINERSLKLLKPIKEFNNTKYEYLSIYKSLQSKIATWIEEMDNEQFTRSLENIQNQIENLLEEVNECIERDNEEEMWKAFTSFKKVLYNLLLFDNHYESFKNRIFKMQGYKQLLRHIEKLKQTTTINFDNLNVAGYIQNVQELTKVTKESFFQLDVRNTKENLKALLRNKYDLFNLVDKELKAYFFIKQYNLEHIQKYLSIINNKHSELKKEIDKISTIDKMFYWSLDNDHSELVSLNNNIHSFIKEYTEIVDSPNSSYSSKQGLYKKIFLSISSFIDTCNQIEKRIDIFYANASNPILKYFNLSKTYIIGLSKIKRNDIILSDNDKNLIYQIEDIKKKIDLIIISNNERTRESKIEIYVKTLFDLVVTFLNTVVKKSTITQVFSLINTKYSYYQFVDEVFHEVVLESEKMLSDGQYLEGLEFLIRYIFKNYINNNTNRRQN